MDLNINLNSISSDSELVSAYWVYLVTIAEHLYHLKLRFI